MVIPKILKNYNLMVDGTSFAGLCEEVTLPTLTIKEEEYRAAGLDAPVSLDMGMEKMELKASMAEHNPVIFQQFGLQDGSATQLLFRGAQSNDSTVTPYTITAQGRLSILAPAAAKPGDKNPIEFTVSLRYYLLQINGQNLIEIDVLNMKRVINGNDVLAAMAALIG